MNRKKILKKYNSMRQSEWYSEDQIRDIQLKKLRNVLEYANSWIPYYQKLFERTGFSPQDIKKLEDIQNIPPLSRQDVIENRIELVDARQASSISFADNTKKAAGEPSPFARFRKHQLVRNTSSGSIGAPTIFYEDGSVTSTNWANELRLRSWYGIKPGAKEMRMARMSTDYKPDSKAFLIRKYLWNQLILPGTNLSDPEYKLCYEKISTFKPRVYWGFTSALYGFAEYIEKRTIDLADLRPELIITWAAPLYEYEKKKLNEVFGCAVTNVYGTREVGHIAGFCPDNSLHVYQDSHYVEITNAGEAYTGKNVGEILVTNLEITPMPFIRYRSGDIGMVASSRCSCGRKLQVLETFSGRTGEVYVTRDGKMISPNFWCRTFMDHRLAAAVKRFQVIYKGNNNIRIRLVRNGNYTQETEDYLRGHLIKNFNLEMTIEFEYLENIAPQVSGKYQMVINEAIN